MVVMVFAETAGEEGVWKKAAIRSVPGAGAWNAAARGREEIRPQVVTTKRALLQDAWGWKRGDAKEADTGHRPGTGPDTIPLNPHSNSVGRRFHREANLALSRDILVCLPQLGGLREVCAVAVPGMLPHRAPLLTNVSRAQGKQPCCKVRLLLAPFCRWQN